VGRIANCSIGETIVLNKTPFHVVGVFDHPGQFGGEIWGDLDRLVASMGPLRSQPHRREAQARHAPGCPRPAQSLVLRRPARARARLDGRATAARSDRPPPRCTRRISTSRRRPSS
jgi:hypothetical protein